MLRLPKRLKELVNCKKKHKKKNVLRFKTRRVLQLRQPKLKRLDNKQKD